MWIEVGAAWGQKKSVVAVFHGMTVADLEKNGQGKAVLEDTNVLTLNEFDIYVDQLKQRVQEVYSE